jgi:16S rRNA (guanine966-N2)-methyltransferase
MSAVGGRLDGLTVLDLFAGSGALGLEALSRGAAHATFVERSRRGLAGLEENLRLLGARPRASVVKGDALGYVRRLAPGAFDLALADPPYGEGHAAALLTLFAEVPFARELWVEHRTGESIPELPGLRQRRYGDTTLTSVSADTVLADRKDA